MDKDKDCCLKERGGNLNKDYCLGEEKGVKNERRWGTDCHLGRTGQD